MTYFFNRTVINLQLGAYQTNIHHFQSKIYTFFCWIIVRKSFFFINFDFLQSTVHFFLISKNLNFCEEQYHRKKKKFSKWKTKKEKKKTHSFCHRQKKFWPVLLCLLVPWRCWKIHYTHAKFVDFIYLVECIVYTDTWDMHQASNI